MVNILADNDNIGSILAALQGAPEVNVDTETSGLDVRNKRDYMMGACIDIPGQNYAAYIPFRHKERNVDSRFIEPLFKILCTKPLNWFNLKFDYHSWATLGVNPLLFKGPQFCGLIAISICNEELYSSSLDSVANYYKIGLQKYDKNRIHDFAKIIGYENMPAEMYTDYGSVDATLTGLVKPKLVADMDRQKLTSVYYDTELPFNVLLYELEARGVGNNSDFTQAKATRGRGRMATLQRDLGFNPTSPLDLGKYLLDELGLPVLAHTDSCDPCKNGAELDNHKGKATFKKVVMEDYELMLENSMPDNHAAKQILEFRGWQKAVTALYEPLLEKVGPDGRVRTNFNQHRAVTGRLTSDSPNVQQIPRSTPKVWNGDAKSCFSAGYDGFALYGWDYPQIEFRIAAAYGNEALLLTEFAKDDADPFSVLAPLIFGILTPDTRHYTKNRFVYPTLYGAGLRKIALTNNQSEEEVRPLYSRFLNTIPGIIGVSRQVSSLIEQRGYVTYWDGRRRHIRNKRASYKGFNAVCQGGSAQILKNRMLAMRELEGPDLFMVMTVHDEITFCIDRGKIQHYDPQIKEIMSDWPKVFSHVNPGIPEGKEWK